jgi:hypothetical protein
MKRFCRTSPLSHSHSALPTYSFTLFWFRISHLRRVHVPQIERMVAHARALAAQKIKEHSTVATRLASPAAVTTSIASAAAAADSKQSADPFLPAEHKSQAAGVSPALCFRMGFHAQPSMLLLHLHVLSEDLNSPALKHKKHWNSFTTRFFVAPQRVIEQLQTHDRVSALSHSLICRKAIDVE